MKIKSLVAAAVISTAVLFSAGFASAQTSTNCMSYSNTSDEITCLTNLIAQLTQQIAQLQAQQVGQTWCHTFTNYSVAGSRNPDVAYLQTALIKEGFDVSGDAPETFGDNTAAAVVQFQGKYGIRQTGTVGPITRAKLNALYGCVVPPTPICSTDSDCLEVTCPAGGFAHQTCVQGKCIFPLGVEDKCNGRTCTPNWTCGWGPCVNGSQAEVATDSSNCPKTSLSSTSIACPALARTCTPSVQCTTDSDCTQPTCQGQGLNAGSTPTCPASVNKCVNGQCVLSKTTPSITVTSPNGGETVLLGASGGANDFRTTWISSNLSGNASIYLNFADGGTCLLGTAPVSQGYFLTTLGNNYQCPNISRTVTAGQYKVLLNTDTPDIDPNSLFGIHDSSDNYFTIVAP